MKNSIFIMFFLLCLNANAQKKSFKRNAIYIDLSQSIALNP